jgi:hypothetical protein
MCKNMVEPDRPHMAIRHMRFACWITNVTNTHLEYVIILAFPRHNGCTNAPQRYVIGSLPVLFAVISEEEGGSKNVKDACVNKPAGHHHNVTKWEDQVA